MQPLSTSSLLRCCGARCGHTHPTRVPAAIPTSSRELTQSISPYISVCLTHTPSVLLTAILIFTEMAGQVAPSGREGLCPPKMGSRA